MEYVSLFPQPLKTDFPVFGVIHFKVDCFPTFKKKTTKEKDQNLKITVKNTFYVLTLLDFFFSTLYHDTP